MVASRALVVVVTSVIFPQVAHAVTMAEDYSIASVESDLRPADRIGSLKGGLVCLPKGKLLWRDIAKPGDAAVTETLSRALSGLGLMVVDAPDRVFGEAAPQTKYRIKVTYESLAMTLCVPGLGIGRKPSGTGKLLVRWETFDRLTKTKIVTQSFEMPLLVSGRDARNDGSVIGNALTASAEQYVVARRSPGDASHD